MSGISRSILIPISEVPEGTKVGVGVNVGAGAGAGAGAGVGVGVGVDLDGRTGTKSVSGKY